jgi:hypothetical protein
MRSCFLLEPHFSLNLYEYRLFFQPMDNLNLKQYYVGSNRKLNSIRLFKSLKTKTKAILKSYQEKKAIKPTTARAHQIFFNKNSKMIFKVPK